MSNMKLGLTFADVLMVPKYSDIESRSQVDLSVDLGKGFKFELPFTPANMSDITGIEMAWKFYTLKGLALLHRFDTFENRAGMIEQLRVRCGSDDILNYVGISIGVKEKDKEELKYFIEQQKVKIICIDIAHLDSKLGLAMTKYVADTYPNILLIAGTVATGAGAERVWKAGCDCVRIGIGAGSICSTRLETNNGVPQLHAIMSVREKQKELQPNFNRKLTFISDGGKSIPAHFCIALGAGADMCMSGNFFSSTSETPGDIVEIDGVKYKQYNGSSTHKDSRIEGTKSLKKFKGPIDPIIKRLKEGIQSCCSYQNSHNLDELKENVEFIQITQAGFVEGGHHNLDRIL